ncbi:uncharacterized protein SPSK_02023 [Sporothrix schenckii 1099-18]|uniref:Uncharacterized protein n=1 Tax=Sporothrix schenckii 1099-18 TaxID=1397361 RepID=A0A0F2ME47_SPOSC|nr:uncharacterized protein SPSK_02023 [Sporothrix schenckii 1099-18]KJR87115.1 hypothetical protein SPSK_02023 [Sporothrix schenckii 1099-18]
MSKKFDQISIAMPKTSPHVYDYYFVCKNLPADNENRCLRWRDVYNQLQYVRNTPYASSFSYPKTHKNREENALELEGALHEYTVIKGGRPFIRGAPGAVRAVYHWKKEEWQKVDSLRNKVRVVYHDPTRKWKSK